MIRQKSLIYFLITLVAFLFLNSTQSLAVDKWIGKPPLCGAKATDCRDKYGMYFVEEKKSSCISGKKVLCRGSTIPGSVWVGKAPECRADRTDCDLRDMEYVKSADCGDGHCCHSGKKVLCKPRTKPAAPSFWLGTAPACEAKASDCGLFGFNHAGSNKWAGGNLCFGKGTKVLCRAPEKLNHKITPANQLGVMSYNIFALPYTITHNGQAERSCQIPAKMAQFSNKKSIDVMVFSEVFIRACYSQVSFKKLLEYYGWNYITEPFIRAPDKKPTNKIDNFKPKLSNSGLLIASRWPITKQNNLVFTNCDGEDCLAAKGVQYVSIEKNVDKVKRTYHIFGTHLQAQPQDEKIAARLAQAVEINQFVNEMNIPMNEAVLFAGDLNETKDSPHFHTENNSNASILNNLKASMPPIDYEKEGIKSSFFNLVIPGSLSKTTHNYDSWLDYVLYSDRHLQPKTKSMKSIQFLPRKPMAVCTSAKLQPWHLFARNKACGESETINYLSDHYAVYGEFSYP